MDNKVLSTGYIEISPVECQTAYVVLRCHNGQQRVIGCTVLDAFDIFQV